MIGLGRMGGNMASRLLSREEETFADKILAMMRNAFGGQAVVPEASAGGH